MWYLSWSLLGNFSLQTEQRKGARVTPSRVELSLLRPWPVYTMFLISSRHEVTYNSHDTVTQLGARQVVIQTGQWTEVERIHTILGQLNKQRNGQ